MNRYSEKQRLHLFKSLFKGRTDVFAIRWEKGSRSGYMPACEFDPYLFRLHKMKGGSFKDFKDKTYLQLSDRELLKHFSGKQFIGIYPLLSDNTSWFIAADFDKENWADECRLFRDFCIDKGIPAYMERSRSGKGGHIWIFFEKPYPAQRSRRILSHFLNEAGIFSMFDKNSSFDRLFPNQDFHSGKGLGNLIALPFNKTTLAEGNNCFIDDNLIPYADQWKYLATVKKASVSHLDSIYNSIADIKHSFAGKCSSSTIGSKKLQIFLKESVRLDRKGMTLELITFLGEELNFANSEYFIRKNSGKSTAGIYPYFRYVREQGSAVIIPRGFVGRLIRYCKKAKIDFDFQDERRKLPQVNFSVKLNLRPHQKEILKATARKDYGVIVAPPGSGKTIIGLEIIAKKQQPALIIVHRKQLFEQWMERIQQFMGIPKREIGRIGQGRLRKGKSITVAMIQSLSKSIDRQKTDDFASSFGTIIVDECHHLPAATFYATFSKLSPYYQYGLTATPFRKGSDGRMIFAQMGEIIAEVSPQEIENYKHAKVVIRETDFSIPFNPKTDSYEILSKALVHDSGRNKLILDDVLNEINSGKRIVILTERKEHIDSLYQYLKQSIEVITLSGDDSNSRRNEKWQLLKSGSYQALITTGQFFGEGTDLQNASCLFLVYPFSFKGKLIQYIGRVQRAEISPIIYDYRDPGIAYLNRLFLKRNAYYRQISKLSALYGDEAISGIPPKELFIIDEQINVPIEELDFQFGSVAFQYQHHKVESPLKFEIENEEIRPEFDVLKPYFSRVLKKNFIEMEIFAELEGDLLIAQRASSIDLDRINRELIESVKFRFVKSQILGKQYASDSKESILGLDDLKQDEKDELLYESEEQLLHDLLKNKNYKHHRQLRYLASRHENSIAKLRFVLNPFSFVFLIRGEQQFYVVLETLDTEEATYVWHFDKSTQSLIQNLSAINDHLNFIRNNGRQKFLETKPENFGRIIHQYLDKKRGFIIWKNQLEERLF